MGSGLLPANRLDGVRYCLLVLRPEAWSDTVQTPMISCLSTVARAWGQTPGLPCSRSRRWETEGSIFHRSEGLCTPLELWQGPQTCPFSAPVQLTKRVPAVGCQWHQVAARPRLPRYSASRSCLAVGQHLPKDKDTLCYWACCVGTQSSKYTWVRSLG